MLVDNKSEVLMGKQIIYETKGRAREFNELACNLFTGCEHGCVYCYAPDILHKDRGIFGKPEIRVTALDILRSAKTLADKGETRRVLLCFTCDPYTPVEQETALTRKCIMALHEAGLNVMILTKAGKRSTRDFDLLTPKDCYATTLTCMNNHQSKQWEINASPPNERIDALEQANRLGIETWASLEPVIYPDATKALIAYTRHFVGHYKVGTMNYHPHGETINWHDYGWGIKSHLDYLNAKYYFKKDLLKAMGVNPNEFKQTWICK